MFHFFPMVINYYTKSMALLRGIFPCDSRGHEHVCAYPIWIVEFAGDQVVFVVLNSVQLLGLIATFEPFLVLPALPE
jgi:hypothetical protein